MSKTRSTKESFLTGASTIIPVMPGIVPFGMLTGVVTIAAGISPLKAIFMTIFMFAGAAQVSVAQLMTENSSAIIIVATAIMINLRFVMYSASITPHLGPLSPWQRYISRTLCQIKRTRFPLWNSHRRAANITSSPSSPVRVHLSM
ncbi:AzlC family ABC transporter permease [Halodesulfovibrio sp. MK-HDV]|uniref:AzlC family ABC transporter permease n=1 Tax=Halodesulfovibrio sp. MK-HDV TaxID=2599925 RepID=UPI00136B24A3|nr:AzlC family ABC transporter permease [Halodesulfovibrio sp. MK-HDV]KAF1076128.1 Inner membrane protein YgaZ [Halodesulfovibrio sp. MK-HDV]